MGHTLTRRLPRGLPHARAKAATHRKAVERGCWQRATVGHSPGTSDGGIVARGTGQGLKDLMVAQKLLQIKNTTRHPVCYDHSSHSRCRTGTLLCSLLLCCAVTCVGNA